MALNIWNFDNFDGYAEVDEQGDYELRIYLKGKCNVEVAICSRVVNENGEAQYNLYNFIVDKDHMKNMQGINWFSPIKKITLYMYELTSFQQKFINFALKNNVDVTIIKKPF